MSLYEKIISRQTAVSLIGLGYVGLPIAVAFSKKANVVGFDLNEAKIESYKAGRDATREVGDAALQGCSVQFTANPADLRKALFHIVAVPTPVNADHTPDLSPLIGASKLLGQNLTKGSVVVYESTVYPGVTEDVCRPILEAESGLVCGRDFKLGYSPERINPGDTIHRLENIVKIVSGMDAQTLETVAKVYGLVIEAGVYRAESIRVAEAAKVIENSQRDINIAFVNELSMIFHHMGIDTKAVLDAAGTKWNFLQFSPGLVGGHCIGVDPYYLVYQAERLGYHSQVILAGRKINDGMGKYAAQNFVKQMIGAEKSVCKAKVAVFGLTFKENCPDTRNSKVIDILTELREYGIEPLVCDPVADADEAKRENGITLTPLSEIRDLDGLILAVAHDRFRALTQDEIDGFFKSDPASSPVLSDLKGILDKQALKAAGYRYWRF